MPYSLSESALSSITKKSELWQDCFVVCLALAALLATWSKGMRISKFAGVCTIPHKSAANSSCKVYATHRVVPTIETFHLQSTAETQKAQPSRSVAQQVMSDPMPPPASQEWVPKDVAVQPQAQPCQFDPDKVSVDVGFEIMRASALSPVKPAMHRADVYISHGLVRPRPPTSSRIF